MSTAQNCFKLARTPSGGSAAALAADLEVLCAS